MRGGEGLTVMIGNDGENAVQICPSFHFISYGFVYLGLIF